MEIRKIIILFGLSLFILGCITGIASYRLNKNKTTVSDDNNDSNRTVTGLGTWNLAKRFPDLFAAIMPMSCGLSYELKMPVYWHSTRSEGDFSERVQSLNSKGANIHYRYHGDVGHGMDCNRIDNVLLDEFFANKRK